MRAFLARSPLGIFAFSDDGQLICFRQAASPEEGVSFVRGMENPLESELSAFEVVESADSYRMLRKRFRQLVTEAFGIAGSDIVPFLNAFGIKYSSSFLSSAVTRDKLLIQASQALEDMKRITNIQSERLWEWFSLHYPEAKRNSLEHAVAAYGNRRNFPGFVSSLGIELTESDEKALGSYAAFARSAGGEKRRLESYVMETAKEIMPNVSRIIDPLLAARFLSLAGSLEKLARMPASTIQLLGAEKALFRHLKQQGKSPKFGILFQDGRIQSAPGHKRGKIARAIASKLMQAARIDFYSGRLEGRLGAELEKELGKI